MKTAVNGANAQAVTIQDNKINKALSYFISALVMFCFIATTAHPSSAQQQTAPAQQGEPAKTDGKELAEEKKDAAAKKAAGAKPNAAKKAAAAKAKAVKKAAAAKAKAAKKAAAVEAKAVKKAAVAKAKAAKKAAAAEAKTAKKAAAAKAKAAKKAAAQKAAAAKAAAVQKATAAKAAAAQKAAAEKSAAAQKAAAAKAAAAQKAAAAKAAAAQKAAAEISAAAQKAAAAKTTAAQNAAAAKAAGKADAKSKKTAKKAARKAAKKAAKAAAAQAAAKQAETEKAAPQQQAVPQKQAVEKAAEAPLEAAKAKPAEPKSIKATQAMKKVIQKARKKAARKAAKKARKERKRTAARALARTRIKEGEKAVIDGGTRVIERRNGQVIIRHDDSYRFRSADTRREVYQLADGRKRIVLTRPNGVRIVTIRGRNGEIILRRRLLPDGQIIVLIDNRNFNRNNRQRSGQGYTQHFDMGPLRITIPRNRYIVDGRRASRRELELALTAPPLEPIRQDYSLEQVRRFKNLRHKMRRIDLTNITFTTDSAYIDENQIEASAELASIMNVIIARNPAEMFMVAGHTDLVGSDIYNLALSDRRAEAVAIALTSYFGVPPENLVTQGYGEQFPVIPTAAAERQNRRVSVRRITPLLRSSVR